MLQGKCKEAENTEDMEKRKNVQNQHSDNVGQNKILYKVRRTDLKKRDFFLSPQKWKDAVEIESLVLLALNDANSTLCLLHSLTKTTESLWVYCYVIKDYELYVLPSIIFPSLFLLFLLLLFALFPLMSVSLTL